MGRARGQNFSAAHDVGGSREPGGIVSIFTDFLLELYLYSLRNCERVERKREWRKEGRPDKVNKRSEGKKRSIFKWMTSGKTGTLHFPFHEKSCSFFRGMQQIPRMEQSEMGPECPVCADQSEKDRTAFVRDGMGGAVFKGQEWLCGIINLVRKKGSLKSTSKMEWCKNMEQTGAFKRLTGRQRYIFSSIQSPTSLFTQRKDQIRERHSYSPRV